MQQLTAGLAILGASGAALAQSSNVFANQKFAWSENVGWTNWADANARADGVFIAGSYLTGYVWGENIGWIDVGRVPANGVSYLNTNNTNYGVNINPATGVLSGYAWAENVGWINFDTAASLSAFNQEARFDRPARRFRGYAWGENIGWVNLDDNTHYVSYCPADVTTQGAGIGQPGYGVPDGLVTAADINFFVNLWGAGNLDADVTTQGAGIGTAGYGTPDGLTTGADINFFVNLWVAGCP
jgi:hypothetical protein